MVLSIVETKAVPQSLIFMHIKFNIASDQIRVYTIYGMI